MEKQQQMLDSIAAAAKLEADSLINAATLAASDTTTATDTIETR